MDILSDVIKHLSINASVFHSGELCGISRFDSDGACHGHLHLVRQGEVSLIDIQGNRQNIREPSLIFYPRPASHRLSTEKDHVVELVCATIQMGASVDNPIARALPDSIVVPLSQSEMLCRCVQWLFEEAFTDLQARQPMLNRLSEIIVINLLRHISETKENLPGLMRALMHPQFSRVINAIHLSPDKKWDLNDMAAVCAMSRSKFASSFKATLGQTPADYLNDWRISIAQVELGRGTPINLIAQSVGYETSASFSRVFKKKTGLTPSEWQKSLLRDS